METVSICSRAPTCVRTRSPPIYNLSYQDVCATDDDQSGYELVDETLRSPVKTQGQSNCRGQQRDGEAGSWWSAYQPCRIKVDLAAVKPEDVCWGIAARPDGVAETEWPQSCQEGWR